MLPLLSLAGKAIPVNAIPKMSSVSPKTMRDTATETGADVNMLIYGFLEFDKPSKEKLTPELSDPTSSSNDSNTPFKRDSQ